MNFSAYLKDENGKYAWYPILSRRCREITKRGIRIDDKVTIGYGVKIGNNVIICHGAFIGNYVEIDSGVKIEPGVRIKSHVAIGNSMKTEPGQYVSKDIPSDDWVWREARGDWQGKVKR